VRLFEDEGDWYRRSSLVDSRFSTGPQPHRLELALKFSGQATGDELYEALAGLRALREKVKG
jgi:hypothetical protein